MSKYSVSPSGDRNFTLVASSIPLYHLSRLRT